MKQFGKILKFELKNYFTNKVFVGVTAFIVAVIIIVMSFPRLMTAFDREDSTLQGEDSTLRGRPVMLLVGSQADFACDAFSAAFPGYQVSVSTKDMEAVKEEIISGQVACAFDVPELTRYTYYVLNLSLYDTNTSIADEVLKNLCRMSAMMAGGMSAEQAGAILSQPIEHETTNLGKNQMHNFFYTYIMIFALYMVILLYGQMVSTNVATEKSSRAMELLITSAEPTAMMFGKVVASCLAGLTQLICVFGSSLLFYQFNRDYWGGNMIVESIFNMPLDLLAYMLVFFVLGFFIYAFMYGAVGSTVSKLEDINTAVMPITMLFILAFFAIIFSMASGNIDNIVMKVLSYIPFTSPMAMFTRIAMSTVPVYQIMLSIAILIVSVSGIGVLSAKIYRVGVLLYGTTPKIGAILKAIRKS